MDSRERALATEAGKAYQGRVSEPSEPTPALLLDRAAIPRMTTQPFPGGGRYAVPTDATGRRSPLAGPPDTDPAMPLRTDTLTAPAGPRPGAAAMAYREFSLKDLVDEAADVQRAANGLTPDERRRRRDVIAARAREPHLRSVGAFDDGRLMGFCYGAPFSMRWPWAAAIAPALQHCRFAPLGPPFVVLELHVLPSMWRHGIGSALLGGVHRHASAHWTLLTRKSTARQAESFYLSQGYEGLPIQVGEFTVMATRLPLRPRLIPADVVS